MTDGLFLRDDGDLRPGSLTPETPLHLRSTSASPKTRLDCLCMEADCAVCYQVSTKYQPTIDLSVFDSWIAIQQIEVSIDLLYRIAADLAANKGWPGVAYEVRTAADDLKTLTRHQCEKHGDHHP